MSNTQQIIDIMCYFNMLPSTGGFEVTTQLIDQFREVYGEVNKANLKPQLGSSNDRYSRKLAAINLLKETLKRGFKPKCGIVYAISNPAFPGYYKIGITTNLDKRLASYQTYDPHRQFKVEHYKFVEDRAKEEKSILLQYKTNLAKGEWITESKILSIFQDTLGNKEFWK